MALVRSGELWLVLVESLSQKPFRKQLLGLF